MATKLTTIDFSLHEFNHSQRMQQKLLFHSTRVTLRLLTDDTGCFAFSHK